MDSGKNNTDDIIIEDMDSYGGGNKQVGIKEISLEQFKLCCREGSKMMSSDNNQKEIFANSVEMLSCILIPHLLKKENEKFRNKIKEIDEQLEEIRTEIINQSKGANEVKRMSIIKFYDDSRLYLIKEKLSVLSEMLEELNYFEERGITWSGN